MRPDQHKKKKNSEYKKKHGIPSGKGEKHDKKGSTDRYRSDEKPALDVSKLGLETDGTDAGESSNHERGKFSRRKIESNLDRYKEDDLEDDCEPNSSTLSSVPIGADFQSLLDNATSGSSHFQFKSEKEWENVTADEANNKDGPSLLSIDCHALAQSLRNIPLEQRLGIDKKYSIEEKCSGATVNKSQLDKLTVNINDKKTTNNNNQELRQNVSQKNMDFSLSQPSKVSTASNKNDKYPVVHKLKSPEQKIQHHSTDPLQSNAKKVQHNAQSTKSDVEDDLELLLGIDNKKLNSTHEGNQIGTQETRQSTTTRPPSWKGVLASGSTNKVDVTTAQKAQPASDTKENLEDWLDSILD